jgi:arylsulfatase A-like enzyme
VLRGERDQHRTEAISGLKSFRIIRTKTHKFVENHGDIDELYDLVNDPQELNNIARENRKLASELSNRMKERFIEGAWHHG